MSPRRNRRQQAVTPVDDDRSRHGVDTLENWPDGQWRVRAVTGSSGKTYRCPGCDQEVRAGTGHLVCWPEGHIDDRRHWHTACWRARLRRGPVIQRSRNAPRYG
ncbi:hypothetical protein [Actinocatenispora thailandica]|uniref:hypothetical protein n=1 Tax=Actinocatenispora thailandica TaxID=227318 RepID=UPI00194F7F31|nr:hypothetical protein [Actinocatenispora thailandica]